MFCILLSSFVLTSIFHCDKALDVTDFCFLYSNTKSFMFLSLIEYVWERKRPNLCYRHPKNFRQTYENRFAPFAMKNYIFCKNVHIFIYTTTTKKKKNSLNPNLKYSSNVLIWITVKNLFSDSAYHSLSCFFLGGVSFSSFSFFFPFHVFSFQYIDPICLHLMTGQLTINMFILKVPKRSDPLSILECRETPLRFMLNKTQASFQVLN